MSIAQEEMDWRGAQLACLTLQDAFRMHLAMRAMVEDPIQAADLRMLELRRTLAGKEQALEQALEQTRKELAASNTIVAQRNSELKTLKNGVAQLEETVAQSASVHRELERMQKLHVESQAQQGQLALKWGGANELLRELRSGQEAAKQRLQELEELLAKTQVAKQQVEQDALRAQGQARDTEARLTQELNRVEECLRKAEAAVEDAQPDPREVEYRKLARVRTSKRLHTLRRTCITATEVERNLERYCNRLEEKLRG
ncbi:MAG: hypothetical protein GY930_00765 [bacterium]|nr:hypothetical protein [bacterium]